MNAAEIKALIDSGKARFDGTRLVMLEQAKVKPKYGNKVTEVAGKKFDSKKEARFFLQLQQDPTVKSIQTQFSPPSDLDCRADNPLSWSKQALTASNN